jgi:hypothetical protein
VRLDRRALADSISRGWSRAASAFVAVARRPVSAIIVVFVATFGVAMALRVAMGTAPRPMMHDELSYVLGAETFLRGRLTNPPHVMARHFETFHVLQRPTYASKYPPANALVIAAGWKLGGEPYVGVALSFALMCASLCWMLQRWVGRVLGFGLALVVGLSLADTYWATSYWGGAVAAGAGALVLGAAYRLIRAPSAPKAWVTACNAVVLALGLLVLANSRPYEGLWFALPVMMVLLVHLVRRQVALRMALLRSAVLPFLLVMAMGGGAMLAFNHAVTGRWSEMPYSAYAKASDPVPVFLWQGIPAHAPPKDEVLRRFQEEGERQYTTARTLRGRAKFAYSALGFFPFLIPATVLFPFLLLPLLFRHRPTRLAAAATVAMLFGMALTTYYFHHYSAAATAAILAVYGACLRLFGRLRLGQRRIGRPLTVAVLGVWACVGLAHTAVRVGTKRGKMGWADHRQAIADSLARHGSKHVVFVRYVEPHPTESEWVFNSADIDASPVVWARDMGAENGELLRYYRDRAAWIVDVGSDAGPFPVRPYTAAP